MSELSFAPDFEPAIGSEDPLEFLYDVGMAAARAAHCRATRGLGALSECDDCARASEAICTGPDGSPTSFRRAAITQVALAISRATRGPFPREGWHAPGGSDDVQGFGLVFTPAVGHAIEALVRGAHEGKSARELLNNVAAEAYDRGVSGYLHDLLS